MLFNIQALRALAALLVVVVHLEALGRPLGLGTGMFDLFAVGVDLFFVISGFIMIHATSGRAISPGRFMLDRLLRIAPLYWTLTLGVFAVALIRPALLGTTQANWGALLRSLLFIPYERVDGTMRPILFVGWSLNLEMAFYLVFAAGLIARDTGRRVLVGVGMLGLAVLLGALLRQAMRPELQFLTQPILLEFAAGMVLGWVYSRLPVSRRMAQFATFGGVTAFVALIWTAQWPFPEGWPVSLVPACALMLAALVAERGGLSITWRPAQMLGAASYALYLTHPFVTQAWILTAKHSGLLLPAFAPFLIVGATASAILVAVMTHRWVELPLGRNVRRWLERSKPFRNRVQIVRQPETAR